MLVESSMRVLLTAAVLVALFVGMELSAFARDGGGGGTFPVVIARL